MTAVGRTAASGGSTAAGAGARMQVIYDYPGGGTRFPYLVLHAGDGTYYKVRLQGRFLFVSQGTGVVERARGEIDIPYVGAGRKPIGDFVYASPAEAQAALERFRTAPSRPWPWSWRGRNPSSAQGASGRPARMHSRPIGHPAHRYDQADDPGRRPEPRGPRCRGTTARD